MVHCLYSTQCFIVCFLKEVAQVFKLHDCKIEGLAENMLGNANVLTPFWPVYNMGFLPMSCQGQTCHFKKQVIFMQKVQSLSFRAFIQSIVRLCVEQQSV